MGIGLRGFTVVDKGDWNKRYAESEFLWTLEPNQFVVAETRGLRPGHALDLAAGEGRNAVWLAEQGWRVTAVDFSEVAVEKGRQLADRRRAKVQWLIVDLTAYEPEPACYDLVLLSYLQLPQSQRRLVIRQARRAVAPGGTFLWIAHDLSNLEHGTGGPRSATVLCSPQDIVVDLPDFEVLKAEVVRRRVGQDGPEAAIALDTLVRAMRRSA